MCRKLELIYSQSSFPHWIGSVVYLASTTNLRLWQLSESQSSASAQIPFTPGLLMHKISNLQPFSDSVSFRKGGDYFASLEPRAASLFLRATKNSRQKIQKWAYCPNMVFITCGVDQPRKMNSDETGLTKSNLALTSLYSFSEFAR